MLKKWVIGNFKSIGDITELDMAPLTLLVGPNSSGKSTVIQSILLVTQTLASRRTDPHLILNGEFVRLGSFEDVLHSSRNPVTNRAMKNPYLTIGFELEQSSDEEPFAFWEYRPTKVRIVIKFSRRQSGSEATGERQPLVSSLNMHVESLIVEHDQTGEGKEHPSSCSLRITQRTETRDTFLNTLLEQKKLALVDLLFRPKMRGEFSGSQNNSSFRGPVGRVPGLAVRPSTSRRQMTDLTPIGVQFNHMLPNRLISYYNAREVILKNSIDEFLRAIRLSTNSVYTEDTFTKFQEFVKYYSDKVGREITPYSTVTEWVKSLRLTERRKIHYEMTNLADDWINEQLSKLEPELNVTASSLPSPFDDAFDWVKYFFSTSIRYLGPLREEPRALYALPPSDDPTDVGLKGEYTAAVLNANKHVKIKYWNPISQTQTEDPLKEAVEHWLHHFGIADSVETQEAGKLGHILTLGEDATPKKFDLTNVGVGVSQVLPILVIGLMANEGSTLIYEQPEIHLHPKLQADIADFFLSLIACNKRCIVETHSEYLVNRLRRRLAESQDDGLLSKVSILFSERKQSESTFRQIKVNQYGAVLEWPTGFFDQAQSEAQSILEAAMSKRGIKS